MSAYKKTKYTTDWKDFEQLCKDIEQNPDKYNWIVIDPLFGIITKNEKGESDEALA